MNGINELLIESQDVQLLVTEGIVSGSKKLINTAITKLIQYFHTFMVIWFHKSFIFISKYSPNLFMDSEKFLR